MPSYGIWRAFVWDNRGVSRHGARLLPDHAPWRALFAALDVAGSALPGDPVTPHEEADTIVACCWRYGTYAHVLATGERYPPCHADLGLARLGDDEMRRSNLECSSGRADWLATRANDPATSGDHPGSPGQFADGQCRARARVHDAHYSADAPLTSTMVEAHPDHERTPRGW